MMTAPTIPTRAHVDAFLERIDPVRGRIILAIDAIASRQPTWDTAAQLQAQMFETVAGLGGLDIQLVFYRGFGECAASRWLNNAAALKARMSRALCAAGLTQIRKVLNHARKEKARETVNALILISDACEEPPARVILDGTPVIQQSERGVRNAFVQQRGVARSHSGRRRPNRGKHMITYQQNVAQRGDALELLRSLLNGITSLVFFDPQFRDSLNRLAYGNEGARQSARFALPAMSSEYINAVCREIARVLRPSGYLMLWVDTFRLCESFHLALADVLKTVDLVAWDNQRMGMGYRLRHRGDFLLVLQKPPLKAKATWTDHGIPNRWPEKVDRKLHPHIKPVGLIKRLIGATSTPGDLIVDPAAGSFVVMQAALELGRNFVGCDIAHDAGESHAPATLPKLREVA
jgi:site-specific DNA-methyltransferase (adenine-specific)